MLLLYAFLIPKFYYVSISEKGVADVT